MATETYVYNKFKLKQFDGNAIDLDDDTIKVALFEDDYDEDLTAEFFDDVSGTEVTGDGYDAGGQALSNVSFSGTTTVLFDADDTVWTGATLSGVRFAIIYKDTGDPETSPLIGYIKWAENKSVTNGTFKIAWDEDDKIIKITSN